MCSNLGCSAGICRSVELSWDQTTFPRTEQPEAWRQNIYLNWPGGIPIWLTGRWLASRVGVPASNLVHLCSMGSFVHLTRSLAASPLQLECLAVLRVTERNGPSPFLEEVPRADRGWEGRGGALDSQNGHGVKLNPRPVLVFAVTVINVSTSNKDKRMAPSPNASTLYMTTVLCNFLSMAAKLNTWEKNWGNAEKKSLVFFPCRFF